jgi:diguanylate cyclase (GGDEF)-like protein
VFGGSRDRRRSVRGVVLGVFDVTEFVGSILARHTSVTGLNLYLFNPSAQLDRRVIYRSAQARAGSPPLSEPDLLSAAHWESSVVVFDQRLGAIVTPAEPLSILRWSGFGLTTLGVGFAITAMTVAYLFVLLQRTVQLEALTTNLQATTDEVTRISLHDSLTGLPNRSLFANRLARAIEEFDEMAPFALLFLDLDHFKAVNDTFGHAIGDRLLCEVAERIRECTRQADTASRLGGDEFAILLADADAARVASIANRLIQSLSTPYVFDARPMCIGVSVGAAIATHATTADDLMVQADLAMYEAKDAGRGTYRLFSGYGRRVNSDISTLAAEPQPAL